MQIKTKIKELEAEIKNSKIYNSKIWLFLRKVYQESKENDILIQAMGMVYMTLLSIVPFLLFLFYIMTLFDFFERFDSIYKQLQSVLLNNLAAGTGETILNYLEMYIFNVDIEQLGAISFFSLVMLIVFMLARIEVTFNQIWNVKDHRDIIMRFVSFWTFITLGTFIITLLSSMTFVIIERYLGMWLEDAEMSQNNLFNYFLFSLNFFVFILAYYLIPNTKVEPLSALVSGVFSGILFILSKNLYAIYVQNVIAYSYERQIYGSLSFFPFFLIWLYLIWLIVLIGAVISYVFQNRDKLKYLNTENNLNQNINALIPIAILVALYKNFNDKNAPALNFVQIQNKIKMPAKKLETALSELKKHHLVAENEEGQYIPQKAADTLNLWELYQYNFIKQNLNIEGVFKDQEMQKLYEKIKTEEKKSFKSLKFVDFLN
ncbi:MAG: YihY/virulence factor BrkB family protein [Halanaerobium sp.]